MTDENGGASVRFTVKEVLQDMDRRHTATLGVIQADLAALKRDVADLQRDRARRTGVTDGLAKTWAAAILLIGVLINIPAFVFYLSGGGR